MKKIIIALLLVVLLLGVIQPFNLFSEVNGTSDPPDTSGASDTESMPGEVKEPKFTKTEPSSKLSLVSYFIMGLISPEDSISYLKQSDEAANYTRYGLTFHGLIPGKTYVFYFEIDPVFKGTMRPKKYYLEWSDASKSYELPTGMDEEPIGQGYVTFTAEDTSVDVILIDRPYTSNEEDLEMFSLNIDTFVKVKLYE